MRTASHSRKRADLPPPVGAALEPRTERQRGRCHHHPLGNARSEGGTHPDDSRLTCPVIAPIKVLVLAGRAQRGNWLPLWTPRHPDSVRPAPRVHFGTHNLKDTKKTRSAQTGFLLYAFRLLRSSTHSTGSRHTERPGDHITGIGRPEANALRLHSEYRDSRIYKIRDFVFVR